MCVCVCVCTAAVVVDFFAQSLCVSVNVLRYMENGTYSKQNSEGLGLIIRALETDQYLRQLGGTG